MAAKQKEEGSLLEHENTSVRELESRRIVTGNKMTISSLMKWPILHLLEQKFIARIHMVFVYGDLGTEALIVTVDDVVYALGTNTSGSLGTGDTFSTLYPKKVEALCGKQVTNFAFCKSPYVLALTATGVIYSWGYNGYYESWNAVQTYMPVNVNPSFKPAGIIQNFTPTEVKTNFPPKIFVSIACGSHHCLALTNNGQVYAWDQPVSDKAGDRISSNGRVPTKIDSTLVDKTVVYITCGLSSNMAVTNTGEVYGWGFNGVGQLGIGNHDNQITPQKVPLKGVIIEKVVCGYAHTLALSTCGELYAWGGNSYGELGVNNKKNSSLPVKVEQPDMGKVIDIAAFYDNHISVATNDRGRVFMWGHCLGQSVTVPLLTTMANMHDVFACFASHSVMHQPFFLDMDIGMGILDCLKNAFDDQETSDLKIEVQGTPIYVHKAVLKIRCEYFRTMFQEHWAESNQSVIEHNQFSYNVYKAFLKYLYTDEVDLPPEETLDLLDLANTYFENSLKRRCVERIKKSIVTSNVAFLYSKAFEYSEKELEESCFVYAMRHMTVVVQTSGFSQLNEAALKSFVIKAAQKGVFRT